jgi:hypothetical protein
MTWARALGLLAAAYVGTVLATVLGALWSGPVPDLGFLVALYAGLHCRLTGGSAAMLRDARPEAMAGLGAAIGYVMDLVGGTPRGLCALACALWLLGLRALSNRLMVRGTGAVIGVAALCMLLFRLSMWLLHVGFTFEVTSRGLSNAIGESFITGLCAPFCFAALRTMDVWLWRDRRAQRGGLAYESTGAKR